MPPMGVTRQHRRPRGHDGRHTPVTALYAAEVAWLHHDLGLAGLPIRYA